MDQGGLQVLKSCMAAAWVVSCLTMFSLHGLFTHDKRPTLWSQWHSGGRSGFSNKKELCYPDSSSLFLNLHQSTSRPSRSTQHSPSSSLLPLCPQHVCCLWAHFDRKSKTRLCYVNITESRSIIVRLGWDAKNEPKQIKATMLSHLTKIWIRIQFLQKVNSDAKTLGK